MRDISERPEQLLGGVIVALDQAGDDFDPVTSEPFLGSGDQGATHTLPLPSGIDGETVDPSFSTIVSGKDRSDERFVAILRQQERRIPVGELSVDMRFGIPAARARRQPASRPESENAAIVGWSHRTDGERTFGVHTRGKCICGAEAAATGEALHLGRQKCYTSQVRLLD